MNRKARSEPERFADAFYPKEALMAQGRFEVAFRVYDWPGGDEAELFVQVGNEDLHRLVCKLPLNSQGKYARWFAAKARDVVKTALDKLSYDLSVNLEALPEKPPTSAALSDWGKSERGKRGKADRGKVSVKEIVLKAMLAILETGEKITTKRVVERTSKELGVGNSRKPKDRSLSNFLKKEGLSYKGLKKEAHEKIASN